MRSHLTAALLVLLVWQTGLASDDTSDRLQNQYQGKVLLLRHPLQSDSLQFDFEGQPLGSHPEGPWTIYGALHVEKIALTQDRLRVEGRRMFFQFDPGGKRLVCFQFEQLKKPTEAPPVKEHVRVEIRLDRPVDSLEEAGLALGRVFALTKADFLAAQPEFWRGYLDGHLTYNADQVLEFTPLSATPISRPSQPSSDSSLPGEPIYRLGTDVKTVKSLSTPDPSYSDAARYEHFSGILQLDVVVDKQGHVARVALLRPLGLGLDEMAVRTVKGWTFEPPLRNGEAVAVALNVEVDFRLY
jgi:TonB family protein